MVSESTLQLTFKKLPFCGLEEAKEKTKQASLSSINVPKKDIQLSEKAIKVLPFPIYIRA